MTHAHAFEGSRPSPDAGNRSPLVSHLDPRTVTLAAILITVVISRSLGHVDSRPGSEFQDHTIVFLVDIGLAVLVLLEARHLLRLLRSFRKSAAAVAAVLLAASLVPALLNHPSDRGFAAVLRLLGVAAIASSLVDIPRSDRRLVVTTAAAVLAVSSAIAIAQRYLGRAVGLGVIGEDGDGVLGIEGGTAPYGLFGHPYILAAWCCVLGLSLAALHLDASRRSVSNERNLPYAALLAIGVLPLGLTMSRSAVLGVVLAGGALLLLAVRSLNRSQTLAVFAVVVIAVAGGAAWNLQGWHHRAASTTGGGDPTTLRGSLNDQAKGLLRADPVLGVGPGNYVLALEKRPDLVALNPQVPRPVHNTPLLLVVEGGLAAAPGVALFSVAVAIQAWRRGLVGWVLLGTAAPFLLLDHLLWSYPQGLVLTGLWLALLDGAAVSEPPEAPA